METKSPTHHLPAGLGIPYAQASEDGTDTVTCPACSTAMPRTEYATHFVAAASDEAITYPLTLRAPSLRLLFVSSIDDGSESAQAASGAGVESTATSLIITNRDAAAALAFWCGYRFEAACDSVDDYPDPYIRAERDALARCYAKIGHLDNHTSDTRDTMARARQYGLPKAKR